MRKVLLLPLLCACNSTGSAPLASGGEVNGVSASCSAYTCTLDINMALEDFDGQPVTDGLDVADFALVDVSVLVSDGGSPVVESAEPEALEYTIGGERLVVPILFDQSGSISKTDPDDERLDGAIALTHTILDERDDPDQLAILSFPRIYASQGTLENTDTWTDFSSDRDEIVEAIEHLSDLQGNYTPIYDSMLETADFLGTADFSLGTRRAMLVMTDGADTDSSASASEVRARLKSMGVPLYIVGLGSAVDFSELSALADATGGLFVSSDVTELSSTFADLAGALFSSVTLSARVEFDEDEPPLYAFHSYHLTGTILYQDDLEIPFTATFFVEAY